MVKKKAEPKKKGPGGAKKPLWIMKDMANKLDIVEGWARDGLTDLQICELLGVSHQTFYTWKNKYPEFTAALQKGKEIVDRQVEKKLFDKAMGYEYVERTKEPFLVKDENGDAVLDENGKPKYEMRVVKEVVKHVVADTTAQIFWLKNRKPGQWRDKQHLEHSGIVGHVSLDHMTDEELEAELAKYDK